MATKTRVLLAPLAAAALAWAPLPAPAADKDVRVVNTPAEAVPVTGTVSLTPGTRVEVGNTAHAPLHVVAADGLRDVFLRSVSLDWIDGRPESDTTIDVPAGKRLVIEHVGGFIIGNEMSVDVTIRVAANGGVTGFFFPAAGRRAGTPGSGLFTHAYRVSAPVRLYHDAGGLPLRVGGLRSALDEGPVAASISISGYLVDLP